MDWSFRNLFEGAMMCRYMQNELEEKRAQVCTGEEWAWNGMKRIESTRVALCVNVNHQVYCTP